MNGPVAFKVSAIPEMVITNNNIVLLVYLFHCILPVLLGMTAFLSGSYEIIIPVFNDVL